MTCIVSQAKLKLNSNLIIPSIFGLFDGLDDRPATYDWLNFPRDAAEIVVIGDAEDSTDSGSLQTKKKAFVTV